MTLHQLVPLVAFLLNVSLAGLALLRNPRSRLNRLFAYLLSGFALWNFGVFMLRQAPTEASARFWEVVIHMGVTALPAFYYHFVLIFLDSTVRRRRTLMAAYGLTALFFLANLTGSPLFMKGVKWTSWGWAPAPGILYNVFFLYFYAFFITGLIHLQRASRAIDSSFRRNRLRLIWLATALTIAGGFVDIIRFALAKTFPILESVYPPGIPANMVGALLFGVAIVRYRMFDVSVAVKKFAAYAVASIVLTGVMAVVVRAVETYFDLEAQSAVWAVLPVGFIMALFLSPLGQPLEDRIDRIIFSRRRGCYQTLIELSHRLSSILDFGRLVHTLVRDLVRGVPLTHSALLIHDPAAQAFVLYREESSTGDGAGISTLAADSLLVKWLEQSKGVLVKEEAKLNPSIVEHFATMEGDLEEIRASVIVSLKIENRLIGILLLGEKLSGEVFTSPELEVLSVVADEAAICLENARLYEELASSNARLQQASQLKSQFLASMSHELRTPLNSIIGFSKVLLNRLDGELNDKQEAYIRSVHNSSTHLLQLINSVLDISRIEAGRLELQLEPVDLHELVEECLESSAPLTRGKPVKLETELPLELPRVHVDRTKVKQVLLNLLSNAIKFTAAGRVVVRAQPEGNALLVSVADTGTGIREEDLPRLFKPFERLETATASTESGTGLGLAISKKFVELHGGRVWAESRDRHGSTFHFTLPVGP